MGYLLYSLSERGRSYSGKKKKKLFSISCKLLVRIVFLFLFYEHHPSSVLITGLMISSCVFYGTQYCGITTWLILMNLSFICLARKSFSWIETPGDPLKLEVSKVSEVTFTSQIEHPTWNVYDLIFLAPSSLCSGDVFFMLSKWDHLDVYYHWQLLMRMGGVQLCHFIYRQNAKWANSRFSITNQDLLSPTLSYFSRASFACCLVCHNKLLSERLALFYHTTILSHEQV